ncbi:ATP-binding Cassette (ABC) Superfamily [Achlya hypogyna]|uniref:ATP-binding Cassette (ABC) Superfamily n=1 Tax=Achlya hypogyna TaxID=1202772 RepID=A0A1V9YYZ6_ACHHY|nr:ATP-binding Cassette (ABC) Superfamily [Achlya hypogyna]
MQALGLSSSALVLSWLVLFGVTALLVALLQTLVALVGGLFPASSPLCIFGLFFAFALALVAFGFAASTLFSKVKTATYATQLVFALLTIAGYALSDDAGEGAKTAVCLLPPAGFVLGVSIVLKAEYYMQGITLTNASALQANHARFSTTVVMLFLDAALYTLLGIYAECVAAGAVWYFPVSPAYWRRSPVVSSGDADGASADNADVEPPEPHLVELAKDGRALVVQRLHKTFGDHVAVDNLSVTFYEGHITCLLGHNGAGKTTAISILTGMLPRTSGDAFVHGVALSTHLPEIQASMGVCPQHNILYDDLTVAEHLILYASIKRVPDVAAAVAATLADVDLVDKANTKTKALSGGMKRKLSVGIALLGDSSIVFLDEPTSGMDPYSRRGVWELLLRNRARRIMILTTHYMEEADVLGDRIAIMANGALQCAGSSLFLKTRFGAGYTLTLVKASVNANAIDTVAALVTAHVPAARLVSHVATEVAFQLPSDATGAFAALFASLDADLAALQLSSYGISVTTLEDVFIKVTGRSTPDAAVTVAVPSEAPPAAGQRSFAVQLGALVKKRFHVAKRDKRTFFNTTLLPVLLLAIGFGVMKYVYDLDRVQEQPRLPLDTAPFPSGAQSPTPYMCLSDATDCTELFRHFTESAPVALPPPVANTTPTVTVFGFTYGEATPPSSCTGYNSYRECKSAPANLTGVDGAELQMAQALYTRGFASGASAVQMGAYLVEAAPSRGVFSYVVCANTSSPHAGPVYKRLVDEAIYRKATGNDAVRLAVASHPLPESINAAKQRKARRASWGDTMGYVGMACFMFALSFFPAGIMTFLVKERALTAKHQQLVSGVFPSAFWAANALWDALSFAPIVGILLVLIVGFEIRPYTTDAKNVVDAFPAVAVLFVLTGVALVPLTYVLSFLLKAPASAHTITVLVNLALGFGCIVLEALLQTFSYTSLVSVWRVSPLFALGDGLRNITESGMRSSYLPNGSVVPMRTAAFSQQGILIHVYYLVGSAAACFAVLALLERLAARPFAMPAAALPDDETSTDADVAAEAARVAALPPTDAAVVLRGLRKVFGHKLLGDPVTAVAGLSLALPPGECFGFLGVNGAGKSTTLKMLMGEVAPSGGSATLAGLDVVAKQIEARRLVGYCPQFDALFDLLTVREHLELYAALRGLRGDAAGVAIARLVAQLHLGAFERVLASDLSGGNKRKLSVAVAMIGAPPIVILDEPSTGMDPVSRRFLWDAISDISSASTVLLTTHSMEECEALCSRVGIMVDGRLECLGSVQHLKRRFGHGLVLDVKQRLPADAAVDAFVATHALPPSALPADAVADWCARLGKPQRAAALSPAHPTGCFLAGLLARDGAIDTAAFVTWWLCEDQFDALRTHMEAATGGAIDVVSREGALAQLKLTTTLGVAFDVVEAAKEALAIAEYAVSQTSLEAIFNAFASKQTRSDDDNDAAPTRRCSCFGKKPTRATAYRSLETPVTGR